jgi:predicted TIM-barrel fold metal-dependent hydrolase
MDRAGVEMCVLSLTSPGVQSVRDPARAAALAQSANDYAFQLTRRYPGRLAAFAAVSLRDGKGAAQELDRAVSELGLVGVLVNGYTNLDQGEDVAYLDEAPLDQFWERVAELRVPVYLHPREPLPSQTRAIRGYPELGGSAWAFGYETASHAVRLMLSGLFDRHPDLQVILGHLGEGLPFLLPRLQHRLDEQREGLKGSKAKRRPSYYFANNFYVTTSGHFHTKPLLDTLAQLGSDRVLFSADYPYEQMDSAARWFDDIQLDSETKRKVGRDNAAALLRLKVGPVSRAAVEAFAS